MKTLFRFILQR